MTLDNDMPTIQIDIPEEKLDLPDGKKVNICRVEISGNDSICTEELLCCISDYLDQDLSIKDIYELCAVIDRCYAQRGYFLARCVSAPADYREWLFVYRGAGGHIGQGEGRWQLLL